MSRHLKTAFNISALALGGAGATIGTLALLTGTWASSGAGYVDLTALGAAFTLASAGVFTLGYRGTKKQAREEALRERAEPYQLPPLNK